jgi:hypothetical protein
MRLRLSLLSGLLSVACSGTTARHGDANVADSLPGGGTSDSADASDWVCPGHWDPCLGQNCNPFVRVSTAGSGAGITAVNAVSGSCVIDEIATWSGVEIKPAFGSFVPVSEVMVFVTGACPTRADCRFAISFANGEATTVTSSYGQGVPERRAQCRGNADCCERSQYSEAVFTPCILSPTDFTVTAPREVDAAPGRASSDGGATFDGT